MDQGEVVVAAAAAAANVEVQVEQQQQQQQREEEAEEEDVHTMEKLEVPNGEEEHHQTQQQEQQSSSLSSSVQKKKKSVGETSVTVLYHGVVNPDSSISMDLLKRIKRAVHDISKQNNELATKLTTSPEFQIEIRERKTTSNLLASSSVENNLETPSVVGPAATGGEIKVKTSIECMFWYNGKRYRSKKALAEAVFGSNSSSSSTVAIDGVQGNNNNNNNNIHEDDDGDNDDENEEGEEQKQQQNLQTNKKKREYKKIQDTTTAMNSSNDNIVEDATPPSNSVASKKKSKQESAVNLAIQGVLSKSNSYETGYLIDCEKRTKVVSLGEIPEAETQFSYCTDSNLFPVGYLAYTVFFSPTPINNDLYRCEIHQGPLFYVRNESTGESFSGSHPNHVWDQVLTRVYQGYADTWSLMEDTLQRCDELSPDIQVRNLLNDILESVAPSTQVEVDDDDHQASSSTKQLMHDESYPDDGASITGDGNDDTEVAIVSSSSNAMGVLASSSSNNNNNNNNNVELTEEELERRKAHNIRKKRLRIESQKKRDWFRMDDELFENFGLYMFGLTYPNVVAALEQLPGANSYSRVYRFRGRRIAPKSISGLREIFAGASASVTNVHSSATATSSSSSSTALNTTDTKSSPDPSYNANDIESSIKIPTEKQLDKLLLKNHKNLEAHLRTALGALARYHLYLERRSDIAQKKLAKLEEQAAAIKAKEKEEMERAILKEREHQLKLAQAKATMPSSSSLSSSSSTHPKPKKSKKVESNSTSKQNNNDNNNNIMNASSADGSGSIVTTEKEKKKRKKRSSAATTKEKDTTTTTTDDPANIAQTKSVIKKRKKSTTSEATKESASAVASSQQHSKGELSAAEEERQKAEMRDEVESRILVETEEERAALVSTISKVESFLSEVEKTISNANQSSSIMDTSTIIVEYDMVNITKDVPLKGAMNSESASTLLIDKPCTQESLRYSFEILECWDFLSNFAPTLGLCTARDTVSLREDMIKILALPSKLESTSSSDAFGADLASVLPPVPVKKPRGPKPKIKKPPVIEDENGNVINPDGGGVEIQVPTGLAELVLFDQKTYLPTSPRVLFNLDELTKSLEDTQMSILAPIHVALITKILADYMPTPSQCTEVGQVTRSELSNWLRNQKYGFGSVLIGDPGPVKVDEKNSAINGGIVCEANLHEALHASLQVILEAAEAAQAEFVEEIAVEDDDDGNNNNNNNNPALATSSSNGTLETTNANNIHSSNNFRRTKEKSIEDLRSQEIKNIEDRIRRLTEYETLKLTSSWKDSSDEDFLEGISFDLLAFRRCVDARGGYFKVERDGAWSDVRIDLGLPYDQSFMTEAMLKRWFLKVFDEEVNPLAVFENEDAIHNSATQQQVFDKQSIEGLVDSVVSRKPSRRKNGGGGGGGGAIFLSVFQVSEKFKQLVLSSKLPSAEFQSIQLAKHAVATNFLGPGKKKRQQKKKAGTGKQQQGNMLDPDNDDVVITPKPKVIPKLVQKPKVVNGADNILDESEVLDALKLLVNERFTIAKKISSSKSSNPTHQRSEHEDEKKEELAEELDPDNSFPLPDWCTSLSKILKMHPIVHAEKIKHVITSVLGSELPYAKNRNDFFGRTRLRLQESIAQGVWKPESARECKKLAINALHAFVMGFISSHGNIREATKNQTMVYQLLDKLEHNLVVMDFDSFEIEKCVYACRILKTVPKYSFLVNRSDPKNRSKKSAPPKRLKLMSEILEDLEQGMYDLFGTFLEDLYEIFIHYSGHPVESMCKNTYEACEVLVQKLLEWIPIRKVDLHPTATNNNSSSHITNPSPPWKVAFEQWSSSSKSKGKKSLNTDDDDEDPIESEQELVDDDENIDEKVKIESESESESEEVITESDSLSTTPRKRKDQSKQMNKPKSSSASKKESDIQIKKRRRVINSDDENDEVVEKDLIKTGTNKSKSNTKSTSSRGKNSNQGSSKKKRLVEIDKNSNDEEGDNDEEDDEEEEEEEEEDDDDDDEEEEEDSEDESYEREDSDDVNKKNSKKSKKDKKKSKKKKKKKSKKKKSKKSRSEKDKHKTKSPVEDRSQESTTPPRNKKKSKRSSASNFIDSSSSSPIDEETIRKSKKLKKEEEQQKHEIKEEEEKKSVSDDDDDDVQTLNSEGNPFQYFISDAASVNNNTKGNNPTRDPFVYETFDEMKSIVLIPNHGNELLGSILENVSNETTYVVMNSLDGGKSVRIVNEKGDEKVISLSDAYSHCFTQARVNDSSITDTHDGSMISTLKELIREVQAVRRYEDLSLDSRIKLLHFLVKEAANSETVREQIHWRMQESSSIKMQWMPHTWWASENSPIPVVVAPKNKDEESGLETQCALHEQMLSNAIRSLQTRKNDSIQTILESLKKTATEGEARTAALSISASMVPSYQTWRIPVQSEQVKEMERNYERVSRAVKRTLEKFQQRGFRLGLSKRFEILLGIFSVRPILLGEDRHGSSFLQFANDLRNMFIQSRSGQVVRVKLTNENLDKICEKLSIDEQKEADLLSVLQLLRDNCKGLASLRLIREVDLPSLSMAVAAKFPVGSIPASSSSLLDDDNSEGFVQIGPGVGRYITISSHQVGYVVGYIPPDQSENTPPLWKVKFDDNQHQILSMEEMLAASEAPTSKDSSNEKENDDDNDSNNNNNSDGEKNHDKKNLNEKEEEPSSSVVFNTLKSFKPMFTSSRAFNRAGNTVAAKYLQQCTSYMTGFSYNEKQLLDMKVLLLCIGCVLWDSRLLKDRSVESHLGWESLVFTCESFIGLRLALVTLESRITDLVDPYASWFVQFHASWRLFMSPGFAKDSIIAHRICALDRALDYDKLKPFVITTRTKAAWTKKMQQQQQQQ